MKRRQPLAPKNGMCAPKRLRPDRGTENTPARPPATDKSSETHPGGSTTDTTAGTGCTNGQASTTAPTPSNSAARAQLGQGGSTQPPAATPQTSGAAPPPKGQPAESEDEADPDGTARATRKVDSAYEAWLGSLNRKDAEAVRVVGRLIRFFVPFDRLEQVFHYGALDQAGDKSTEVPENTGNGKFELKIPVRCAYQWRLLKDGLPVIQDLLDRHDRGFLARRLTFHRGQTRGEDTRRCKNLALALRKWDPPITGADVGDKTVRGLGHPQMAQLLLPPSEDFNDPETREAYLKSGDTRKRFSSSIFPRLLYPEDDPLQEKGPVFLKSMFLTRLAQGLVLGADAAVKGDRVAAGNSITNKHNVRFATLPFLGYVGCQGRCAIANEVGFGASGERGFKYKLFYNEILRTLVGIEALGPAGEDAITDLLTWWEEQVWGEDAGGEEEPEQNDDAANEEVTSTPDHLIALYKRSIAEEEQLDGGGIE